MVAVAKFIADKLAAWKERRFLKKWNCKSREEYNHRYDPDIQVRANQVRDYYYGYPYVVSFNSSRFLEDQFGDWLQGLAVMRIWCRENCHGKARSDILRVDRDNQMMNEMFGYDTLFFAFQSAEDHLWFQLRWA